MVITMSLPAMHGFRNHHCDGLVAYFKHKRYKEMIHGQPSKYRRPKHPKHSSTPTMPSVIIQQAIFWLQVSVKHLAQSTHSDQSCHAKIVQNLQIDANSIIVRSHWQSDLLWMKVLQTKQDLREVKFAIWFLRYQQNSWDFNPSIDFHPIPSFLGSTRFHSRFCCRCLECWCQTGPWAEIPGRSAMNFRVTFFDVRWLLWEEHKSWKFKTTLWR